MKNRNLKTAFWRNAANSLPAAVRERYMAHFEAAERWDLALDAVVDSFSRLASPSGLFRTSSSSGKVESGR